MTASGEHKGTHVLSSCAGLGFSLALNPSAPNHQRMLTPWRLRERGDPNELLSFSFTSEFSSQEVCVWATLYNTLPQLIAAASIAA